MDPVTTVTTALSAGSHVLSLLKGAAEQAKAIGKSDLISSLIDVQLSMMELLTTHQKLIEENNSLKERIRALEEQLQLQADLEHHQNAYWKREADDKLDGPFSMHEWDTHRRLVRLHAKNQGTYSGVRAGYYVCNATRQNVFIPITFLTQHGIPLPRAEDS